MKHTQANVSTVPSTPKRKRTKKKTIARFFKSNEKHLIINKKLSSTVHKKYYLVGKK